MTINFNKVYPSLSNCEVVHSWNDYGSVCVEKVMYEGTIFSYDFCVADKVYINLVSGLFDPKMYLLSEPSHEFLTKDFSLEDLNSVAEQMGVSVSQDKEQVAKGIIKEIENIVSVKLNKTPCSKMEKVIIDEYGFVIEKVVVTQEEFKKIVNEHRDKYTYYTANKQPVVANFIDYRKYEEWFLIEEEHKIYVVPKNKFDFSKYDYLPDMVDFMEDVKYMFDNHNSPNNYPFSKVQLGFDRMFDKGMVQAEEVKNGLGETFQSFMSVWIEAYSLLVGKECQLKEFFNAIEDGLYVKDILPFVAKVVKEKYTG